MLDAFSLKGRTALGGRGDGDRSSRRASSGRGGRRAACKEGDAHVCEKLGLIGIDTDSGMAELVKARAEQLFRVPEAVPDEQAALVEPLAVAVHVVRTSEFRPEDLTVVMGAGPIGNQIAQVLGACREIGTRHFQSVPGERPRRSRVHYG